MLLLIGAQFFDSITSIAAKVPFIEKDEYMKVHMDSVAEIAKKFCSSVEGGN